MSFAGFPQKLRYTPVPNPLFGPLLEQIDDMGELKCTLRLIWLLHQRRGFPRYVSLKEVSADLVLIKALSEGGNEAGPEIGRALALAVRRGTFLTGLVGPPDVREQVYMMNTDADRRALADLQGTIPGDSGLTDTEPWEGAAERPNIFALYEDNIGLLSPMIAEELKEAEEAYPQEWIEDALREAVSRNKRSWRYVAAILERWQREGRTDGGAGRHPKKAGYEEYIGR